MRIYKISTDLTEERDEYLKSNLTREEEKKIFRYFEDGNISYDLVGEDGTITSYFMCIKEVLDYVTSLFYKYEVKFHINDITNDFLLGKINIDDVSFNNYLKENLNIDLILDKINELGINSLTDLDKEILLK
jgi:hypothetical protein